LACLCAGLEAKTLRVGEDAPNFKALGKVINPPEAGLNLDECRNDVLLIHEWHARDTTAGACGVIQKYWNQYAGKGLHVWTIHRLDFEKWPEVEVIARKNKYTFPVAMGGFYDEKNDFFGYKNDSPGFRTTVVGVDGKVAFYGTDGWEAALKTALAACVYPNLGKHVVDKGAERQARTFAKREFGKAITDCESAMTTATDEAKPDLQLMIKRAKAIGEERNTRIKAHIEAKRYDRAIAALEVLEREFRGHEIGDAAKKQLAEIKKDRSLKLEIEALNKLQQVIDKHGSTSWSSLEGALRGFALANRQWEAAKIAEAMADELKEAME
jgi:hypothetical protein